MTPQQTAGAEKLRLERDAAIMERDFARQQLDHMKRMVDSLFGVYGHYLGDLSMPHYMTSEELRLFKCKGAEALLLAWSAELREIDGRREKTFGFPLPKSCPCQGTGKKYDPIAGEDYPCPTCSPLKDGL